jgi:hypothetical protein
MTTIRKFTAEAWKRGEQFRAKHLAEGSPSAERVNTADGVRLAIGWQETHDQLHDLIEDAPTEKTVNLILEAFALGYRTALAKEQIPSGR